VKVLNAGAKHTYEQYLTETRIVGQAPAGMGLGKEVASAADEEAKTIYTDSGERYWADPGERPGSE